MRPSGAGIVARVDPRGRRVPASHATDLPGDHITQNHDRREEHTGHGERHGHGLRLVTQGQEQECPEREGRAKEHLGEGASGQAQPGEEEAPRSTATSEAPQGEARRGGASALGEQLRYRKADHAGDSPGYQDGQEDGKEGALKGQRPAPGRLLALAAPRCPALPFPAFLAFPALSALPALPALRVRRPE